MENGITLNQNSNGNKELNDFKALFEVVFVDPSGLLNFAANMSLTTLEQVSYILLMSTL